jgi:hypothetical protein
VRDVQYATVAHAARVRDGMPGSAPRTTPSRFAGRVTETQKTSLARDHYPWVSLGLRV